MFEKLFIYLVAIVSGISFGLNISMITDSRRKRKRMINESKHDLYRMMDDFIAFYDLFEEYFDKDMNRDELIPILKQKSLIDGDFIMVPFGDKRMEIPVDTTEKLRKIFYENGELILDIGDGMKEILHLEEIENYGDFSARLDALRKICIKHGMDFIDDEIRV